MRVLLIGQKAFGADALAALVRDRVELVGALIGTSDLERADPLEAVAAEAGIDSLKVDNLMAPEVEDWVRERRPDLIVMAFVTLYMPMSLARVAPLGALNFHPSLLPLHRGISAIPWTILCGDEQAGLSVYFVDEGMDTGEVVVQKAVDVDAEDDFKSLYFKKIYPLGVEAIVEAVRLVAMGNPPRVRQDESRAGYEPPIGRRHLTINWSDHVEQNRRRVRAGTPGLGGIAFLEDGREMRIYGCKRIGQAQQSRVKAGQVVEVKEGGILVQGTGGMLLLTNLCLAGEAKMDGGTFAANYGVSPGTAFK